MPPASTETITIDGVKQQVIAWDMTTSGLYDNSTGDRPSICMGQTIFGLTSTTGQSTIHDINFVADIAEYENLTTSIASPTSTYHSIGTYNLKGQSIQHESGVIIKNGKKVIVK